MWEVYRNTFVRFQLLIAVGAGAAGATSGFRRPAAGMVFAGMQSAALLAATQVAAARPPMPQLATSVVTPA